MKLKDITLRDYILNENYRKAVDSIDIKTNTTTFNKRFNKRVLDIPSLKGKWFTFRVRLFLSQSFEQDELVMISLAVYFMQYFYDKFDEKYIPDMFKKVLYLDAVGAMNATVKFWKEYEEISNSEKALSYNPTPKEREAGIDKLNIFGEWGSVDTIAKRMMLKHEEVLDLPYFDCFLMMKKDLEVSLYNERYMNIVNK